MRSSSPLSIDARIALRACERNQEAAIAYLLNKREQKIALKEQERQQREERRERQRAGKTVNGQWVDVALLKELVGMGFARNLTTEALRETNNDEAAAITLLTESPEVLMATRKNKRPRKATPIPEEDKIEQVQHWLSSSLTAPTTDCCTTLLRRSPLWALSGRKRSARSG